VPILPQESDIFPEDLLTAGTHEDASLRWWVLYTQPRREKDLMRRLRYQGIFHYLPLIARRTRSPAGRQRVSFVPLFASYVFLCGAETARSSALQTNCVCRCLEVDDARGLVEDLRQIHRLIQAGIPLAPEARIQAGMRVRVRSGPLLGTEGMVIKRRGADRLLVVVKFLQQGASIEIDDFQVERIDGA